MKQLLIIIPACNEQDRIGAVLDALASPEIAEVADVLVVNDGSTDRTGQIVLEHGVTLVSHVYNLGYGSGLQVGYKYAMRHGYRYVIQMDADGQHDACNVPAIYAALTTPEENGKCPDIVLGSRFLEGSRSYPIGGTKKAAIFYFRFLIRLITGRRISDPTTGLQGLNRRTFQLYAQFNQFDERYPDANIIIRMLLLGYRVKEVPAVMYARVSGSSMHSGAKPIVYMIRMTLSILSTWIRVRVLKIDRGID